MSKINLLTISKQIYDAVQEGRITDLQELLKSAEEAGITHVVDSYVDSETGNTSLHNAAFIGNANLILLLLQYGANPNKTNKKNQTPLQILNKKTTNQSLKIISNTEKISIDTSSQALSPFGLQYRQEIKTNDGKIATVYGTNTEGELCVWIEGNFEVTVLKEFKDRNSLIENNYAITNKKSDRIQISQIDLSELITVKIQDDIEPPTQINCSETTLKNMYNVSFLQRILTNKNKIATVYGVHQNGHLCYLYDNDTGIRYSSAKNFDELIYNGYTILNDTKSLNPNIFLDGLSIKLQTINANPYEFNDVNLIPFQRYETRQGFINTFYGLSNDNKAILISDDGSIQIHDPEQLLVLHKKAKEVLTSAEEEIISAPDQNTLLEKLRKLYFFISDEIIEESLGSFVESEDAKITLNLLNKILNETEYNSVEDLKTALQEFFIERWNRIKDIPYLIYTNNTISKLNQLCIHIAKIIDPDRKIELLIPALEFPEDTNGTNINQLEFGQFILVNDGTQFIDLISLHKNAFQVIKLSEKNYYQFSEFKTETLDEETRGQETRPLNTNELNQLLKIAAIKEFKEVAEMQINATKLTALGVLNDLCEGLKLGDASTNKDFEYDAGPAALERLVWFSEKYNNMDPENKKKLDNIKINQAGVAEKTLGEFINNRLLLKNAGEKSIQGQLDAYYCLEINGQFLYHIIEAHQYELRQIPMGAGSFAEIGTAKLENAYTNVITALKNPNICTEPFPLEKEVSYLRNLYGEKPNQFIRDMIAKRQTTSFREEFPLFSGTIKYLREVLNEILNIDDSVKSEIIELIISEWATDEEIKKRALTALNQQKNLDENSTSQLIEIIDSEENIDDELKLKILPLLHASRIDKIKEVVDNYIGELYTLLATDNLTNYNFTTKYHAITQKLTNICGYHLEGIIADYFNKNSISEDQQYKFLYLNIELSQLIESQKLSGTFSESNNSAALSFAENLISKLLNYLSSCDSDDPDINEIKMIHSLIFSGNYDKLDISKLINSELDKLNGIYWKDEIHDDLFSRRFGSLIPEIIALLQAPKKTKSLVKLLSQGDSIPINNQEDYLELVGTIKLFSKTRLLTNLFPIFLDEQSDEYTKEQLKIFANSILTNSSINSIKDAERFKAKNILNRLIKSILTELSSEKVSLDQQELVYFLRSDHLILSTLTPKSIDDLIDNATEGFQATVREDLKSIITAAQSNNLPEKPIEKLQGTSNKAIVYRIIQCILDQKISIYDNISTLKDLTRSLYFRKLSENDLLKAFNEVICENVSHEVKSKLFDVILIASKENTENSPILHLAGNVQREHIGHEELRESVQEFISDEIEILDKIISNHVRASTTSFENYNQQQRHCFENALGDRLTPDKNTLRGLKFSLKVGTVDLEIVKEKLQSITDCHIITPLKDLDKNTTILNKIKHWIQTAFDKLDKIFFNNQKTITIDVKKTQNSLYKNANTFFNKAMSQDWTQPENENFHSKYLIR